MIVSFFAWMVIDCIGAELDKDLTAEMIASKMFYANNWETSVSEVKMEMIDRGIMRHRTFMMVEKDRNNNDYWSIIKFTSPKDIKDSGLLTINLWKQEPQQWIFGQGNKKVRQILSTEKQEQLIGSDLIYEDFRKREIELDIHLRLPDRKFHGLDCYVVRSTPKNRATSVYDFREYCIHPQNFLPLEIEYFIKDKKVKRMSAVELKQVQFFWTLMAREIEDLISDHKTRLEVLKVKYDVPIGQDFFTVNNFEKSREFKKIINLAFP